MTMRNSGNYTLEELVSDIDGSNAYRVVDPDTAGSWERAQIEPACDLEWVAGPDDDSDDLDIGMTLDAYGALVAKGRTHCPSCEGCAR